MIIKVVFQARTHRWRSRLQRRSRRGFSCYATSKTVVVIRIGPQITIIASHKRRTSVRRIRTILAVCIGSSLGRSGSIWTTRWFSLAFEFRWRTSSHRLLGTIWFLSALATKSICITFLIIVIIVRGVRIGIRVARSYSTRRFRGRSGFSGR